MGLVEVGVGLIPAGGGTTELLFRFAERARAVRRGRSVRGGEARVPADRDGDDEHERARGAKARLPARRRSDHDEPRPADRRRGGARARPRAGLRARRCRARSPRWARRRSATCSTPCGRCTKAGRSPTTRCGSRTSWRTCSPAATARRASVTEQDILDLEREAFLRLLGTKETQERMQYTLKTGKPLRQLTLQRSMRMIAS